MFSVSSVVPTELRTRFDPCSVIRMGYGSQLFPVIRDPSEQRILRTCSNPCSVIRMGYGSQLFPVIRDPSEQRITEHGGIRDPSEQRITDKRDLRRPKPQHPRVHRIMGARASRRRSVAENQVSAHSEAFGI
jgi:hypothetical protein